MVSVTRITAGAVVSAAKCSPSALEQFLKRRAYHFAFGRTRSGKHAFRKKESLRCSYRVKWKSLTSPRCSYFAAFGTAWANKMRPSSQARLRPTNYTWAGSLALQGNPKRDGDRTNIRFSEVCNEGEVFSFTHGS